MAQVTHYSSFVAALKQWGMGDEASITCELKWQRDITGNTQKIKQIQELVGGL